ncbi:glutamate receptor 2.8-like [Cornus florida]|uniref:glutamate receptor 2.8-like n=1 Tax=Cornus florida TaxID=4283 RepID=UPI00289DA972|nr:glutamate receptor 2.8-like [Cornus florida]
MDSMPCLTSFLFFFIILWLHFLCVANTAYAGKGDTNIERGTLERRTSLVSNTPVGEQECQASIPNTLKLWVPKKKGFNEFVSVCKDNTRALNPCVTGFSIDVFRAALELLPFKVNEPQFSTFDTEDYDEFLKDVPANPAQYDAIVGDVTIKGYQASWVDFTMSYLDSSIYILVPTKQGTRKNMWIFLKPLSPNLWLGIIMAFIFVGVLIGTLEMRSNIADQDFSGPLLRQLGIMIWYPVSMLVLPESNFLYHYPYLCFVCFNYLK